MNLRDVEFHFRVSKYNPEHRLPDGGYGGPEEPVSDHGPVEQAYVSAVEEFCRDLGASELEVRDPSLGGINFGLEPHVDGYGVPDFFEVPDRDFYDGALVPVAVAQELVRAMLRDNGLWCRLESSLGLQLQIGYDQYMSVSSAVASERAVAAVQASGLFVEPMRGPAYDPEPEVVTRPTDDGFWREVLALTRQRGELLLQECNFQSTWRWHRIDPASLQRVREHLAPRAGVLVWEGLETDLDAVVTRAVAHGLEQFVLLQPDGVLVERFVYEDELDQSKIASLLRGAVAATALSSYVDHEPLPLLVGVRPDADGVVRSRWYWSTTPA